ncbi:ribonuclease [Novosphingobium marinum]|uniref:Membrane protein n=1 Tax=Novosphingobium marinum TaxID=1514948 RepID=A0A7Y9XWL9_9SPHN|nr:YihY/virulence factor BrkB family protein [Novosphingobium marinum]NYH95939.1 membrane protein [Novosphingobium marinum]GGC31174.1 ribonuclease [Novosphingobium marinum]
METTAYDTARPSTISARGWGQALWRVKERLAEDHVSVVSAGVAFYGLLALFPAIAALISIAALVMDPMTVQDQLSQLAATLPASAAEILQGQGEKVAQGAGSGLGLAAIFGLLLTLYSASKGVKTLIEGMNVAYKEQEDRGFIRINLLSFGLTLLVIIGLIAVVAFLVAVPVALAFLELPPALETVAGVLRWIVLAALAAGGLGLLYRLGPSRETPGWRWVLPGAAVATVIWILGSAAFTVYVRNFGSYNETYGALGGVIILLTWLWLSAFIVLFGAELNSELEHPTRTGT